ncbi:hypothetical protein [Siccibacter turicensis]|uniref:hypothetical protein n=1 Tax=Siccibacter turicensis TaxID=357233 RepID=UPI002A6A16C9|nr:hypothetical protein [Siccibacter turicensis]MDY0972582.1 hypothetical protein [Siccibacter turicensis]
MESYVEVVELIANSRYEVVFYDEDDTRIGGFDFKASSLEEAEQQIRDANSKARREQKK